jgi:hypothetical protein
MLGSFTNNSALTSQYVKKENANRNSIVKSRVSPLAVGILKLRLSINIGKLPSFEFAKGMPKYGFIF